MSSDNSNVFNDELSSTGSRDDESTGGSISSRTHGRHPPVEFYTRLHAWMVVYDRNNYLIVKTTHLDAEATQESRQEREEALTEKRTTEINLERQS